MPSTFRTLLSLVMASIASACVAALGIALMLNLLGWSATASVRLGSALLLLLSPVPLLLASVPRTRPGYPPWIRALAWIISAGSALAVIAVAGVLAYLLVQAAQRSSLQQARIAAADMNAGIYASSVQYAAEKAEPAANAVAWYTVPGGVLVDVVVMNAPFQFDFDAVRPSNGALRGAVWIEPRTMIEGTANVTGDPIRRFVAYVAEANSPLVLKTPIGDVVMPAELSATVPPQYKALRIFPR